MLELPHCLKSALKSIKNKSSSTLKISFPQIEFNAVYVRENSTSVSPQSGKAVLNCFLLPVFTINKTVMTK